MVFPVYAGVILPVFYSIKRNVSFPRIRGGDPNCVIKFLRERTSPYTRRDPELARMITPPTPGCIKNIRAQILCVEIPPPILHRFYITHI